MKTIWKFPLNAVDNQTLLIPKCEGLTTREQILSVGMQGPTACLWAIVDSEAEKRDVPITIHGTGHIIADEELNNEFIGTLMMFDGRMVVHVFLDKTKEV